VGIPGYSTRCPYQCLLRRMAAETKAHTQWNTMIIKPKTVGYKVTASLRYPQSFSFPALISYHQFRSIWNRHARRVGPHRAMLLMYTNIHPDDGISYVTQDYQRMYVSEKAEERPRLVRKFLSIIRTDRQLVVAICWCFALIHDQSRAVKSDHDSSVSVTT